MGIFFKGSSGQMGQARVLSPEPLSLFIFLDGGDKVRVDVTKDRREIHDMIAHSFSTGTTLFVDTEEGVTRHLNPRYIKEIRIEPDNR